jgi:hypothetical protein
MADNDNSSDAPSTPPDWDRKKHSPKEEKKPSKYLHQPELGESDSGADRG